MIKESKLLIAAFAAWRVWITAFALFGIAFVDLRSHDFLGGGFKNYISNQIFWGWANFDGEHYLAIADHGYERLNHSFFPVYPLLVRFLSLPFWGELERLAVSGLFISNVAFLASLFVFWKLLLLDFSPKISKLAIFSLLLFPTSFFFGSVYTESLFLFLVLSSSYLARKQRWLWASILGSVASVVRVTGIFLLPALLFEAWQQRRVNLKELAPLLLIPAGLLSYMYFLNQTTGSPFTFYNELSTFGVQRQGDFVLLPQVFYRYIKMLLTVTMSDPFYITLVFEFLAGMMVPVLLIYGYFKKVRLSYLVFGIFSYILPTFTGSFSSLPRYTISIFPVFFALAIFLSTKSESFRRLTLVIFALLLFLETVLFFRGYWVG